MLNREGLLLTKSLLMILRESFLIIDFDAILQIR